MTGRQNAATATIRIAANMAEIDRASWDICANPGWCDAAATARAAISEKPAYNPFVSWDFLEILERSGSVGSDSGWIPRHLVLEDDGQPAAFMPCYVKSHSQGEYVFDWGWADAFERAGGRYYPKLQVSVPFTPVTGPRLLTRPGPQAVEQKQLLAAGLMELCRRNDISSAHITFLPEQDWSMLAEKEFLQRTDQQFRWSDDDYGDFDGFLAALASRKRKAVRKERREALANGISIEWLTGNAISESDWDTFFAFYMDTGARKWGQPYLNRRFFSLLGERMADHVLLVMARRDGRPIAGALNLIGSDTLYGRYWGAVEHHPCLHFEVCYYQAIDYALAHRLRFVEAGAQGAHKLARGYVPVTTYSAHYIADRGFRRAVAAYLNQERSEVAFQGALLAEHAPFRRAEVDRGTANCDLRRDNRGDER